MALLNMPAALTLLIGYTVLFVKNVNGGDFTGALLLQSVPFGTTATSIISCCTEIQN